MVVAGGGSTIPRPELDADEARSPMKIVFVYPPVYTLGGIETWLTRVLPGLQRMGHQVALLTRPPVEPWDETSEIVDRLSDDGVRIHLAGRHWFRHRAIEPPLPAADVLFAGNLNALLLAALVQQELMPEASVVAGVFHPREYCSKAPLIERRWSQHLTERLIRDMPVENFVCCSEGMARQTGACLGRDLSGAPVFPIPIDIERFRPEPKRAVERGKIVSIARLHPLYQHHDQMIDIIREFRERGQMFTYHAYGYGPTRTELEAKVRRAGVEDAVFFHGAVPYARIPDVLEDAWAFVGTGTALLEAAASGIPSLVVVPDHPKPVAHGWIQDVPTNEFGGNIPGHPVYPIADCLVSLAERTDQEYRQLGEGARRRAEEFGLPQLLPRFPELLAGAVPFALPISPADRALAGLDWLLEAVLLHLGAPDGWTQRYVDKQAA